MESAAKKKIKKGDTVMVVAGGNKKTRPIKGKTGRVIGFVGEKRDRVLIEGVNMITRHQRAKGPDKPAGKVNKEAPVHISNVMYYAEKIQKPVKIQRRVLEDGRKVRGYTDPSNGQFVQIDV